MYNYRVKQENTEKLPTAIVLGGTLPHAELLKLLKQRGFYTILIDYYDNPPAAKFADVHCCESAMEYDIVYGVAKEMEAKAVFSCCLDQQINIAMKVAEELDLAHPFSSETAEKVTNKRLMKKIMMEAGIPTSRYYVVDASTDLDSIELTYPIIVKPADGCGSAGVVRLDSPEDLKATVAHTLQWGKSSEAIVEEFVEGTEMAVHGYVKDGKSHIIFHTCKIVAMKGEIYQQLGNFYLPNVKPVLKEKLEKVFNQIVKAFELPANTPLFMQLIVRNGEVSVIEFSPRVAGGTSSAVAKEYAGFDSINYSVDSYLGTDLTKGNADLKQFVACFPLFGREGIFDHVEGADQLLKEGTVREVLLLKEPGTKIDMSKPSSSNIMKYVIAGEDCDDCFEKLGKASRETVIVDREGKSMRDHTFTLTKELFYEKLKEVVE